MVLLRLPCYQKPLEVYVLQVYLGGREVNFKAHNSASLIKVNHYIWCNFFRFYAGRIVETN